MSPCHRGRKPRSRVVRVVAFYVECFDVCSETRSVVSIISGRVSIIHKLRRVRRFTDKKGHRHNQHKPALPFPPVRPSSKSPHAPLCQVSSCACTRLPVPLGLPGYTAQKSAGWLCMCRTDTNKILRKRQ